MLLQQVEVASTAGTQHWLREDMKNARRIQRSFLPAFAPLVEGFRVNAEYRPAFDIGGDFYDVVATGPGRVTAVIGDVSGKGVSGALVMSHMARDVRRLAKSAASPRALIEQLDESFVQLGFDDLFVTAACVTLDSVRGEAVLCNAGHVLPLARRASGEVEPLGVSWGPPLGMFAERTYRDETFALGAGDIVLLMTDGVTEALHRDDDALGMWILLDLLERAPRDGAEINRRILAAVARRADASAHLDDLTLLALELAGRTAP
jgi:sigma-B regulation protein RsbU (phosphoserine phosphatase)